MLKALRSPITPDERVKVRRPHYDGEVGPPPQTPANVRHKLIQPEEITWREFCWPCSTAVRMELQEGEPLVPRHLDDPCLGTVGQRQAVGRLNQQLTRRHKIGLTPPEDNAVIVAISLGKNEGHLLLNTLQKVTPQPVMQFLRKF